MPHKRYDVIQKWRSAWAQGLNFVITQKIESENSSEKTGKKTKQVKLSRQTTSFHAVMATVASILDGGVDAIIYFFQTYGWITLIGVIIMLYLRNKLHKHAFEQRAKLMTMEQKKYDTSEFVKKQETMEAARRRLQEKYDAAAAEHAEKQKLLEEKKLQEKLEDWENHKQGKGYRNKAHIEETKTPATNVLKKTDKKPLRGNDYNPLTGLGGGSCDIRRGRTTRGGFGGSGGG